MKIDFFKFALLIILLAFLYLFYDYSENGRYSISNDGNSVIDTRTGIVKDIP